MGKTGRSYSLFLRLFEYALLIMSTCIGEGLERYGIVMYELGGIPFLVFFLDFFSDISHQSGTFLLKSLAHQLRTDWVKLDF